MLSMIDLNLYGTVSAADDVVIGEGVVLGAPKEQRVIDRTGPGEPVRIGPGALLMHYVIVYEGTSIGAGCFLDDRVRVGYGCHIGDRCRLTHGAYLGDRVRVEADCVVAGFVCDGTYVGAGCTVMGRLVHQYSHPHLGWWGPDEAAPVIQQATVVGFGAVVVGGVRIGPRSYVAAGAIVTRDVPEGHIVTGINVATPASLWTGSRLSDLISTWTVPASEA